MSKQVGLAKPKPSPQVRKYLMREYELDCIHGVGHSAGLHGCDGCCLKLTEAFTDREIRAQAVLAAAYLIGAKGMPNDAIIDMAEKFVKYIKEGA
jgi:uncharacterized alpha/beta hydrolase family protein